MIPLHSTAPRIFGIGVGDDVKVRACAKFNGLSDGSTPEGIRAREGIEKCHLLQQQWNEIAHPAYFNGVSTDGCGH
jgi:hypothetical protein